MINFSPIAFEVRRALSKHLTLSQGQILELVAAALSYRSYAALRSEDRADHGLTLEDADHVVLQQTTLARRMKELGIHADAMHTILETIVDKLKVADGAWKKNYVVIHRSLEDFGDFLRVDVERRAHDDPVVTSAYAETNAQIDEFYTDDIEYSGPIFTEPDAISIVMSGTHSGDQDPERVYHGDRGPFSATYCFDKAGRCGLVETDLTFELDFEYD
ncbi:MAG: hypothetical protein JSR92_16270 [Proteobacteria bacterium]|nr:hypothetical protein [Pseudomonadota bacterium]